MMTFNQFTTHTISRPAFAKALLEWHGLNWQTISPGSQAEFARMCGPDADLHQRAWNFCMETGVNPVSLTETVYSETYGIPTPESISAAARLVAP